MKKSLAPGPLLLAAASLELSPEMWSWAGHFLKLLRTHLTIVYRTLRQVLDLANGARMLRFSEYF